METGYSNLQSSNFFVECFRESMPLIIAAILLYLYYNKRISIIDALLYAFASEAYTMLAIGPTFTATFFVGMFIFLEQAHQLFTGKQFIRREYLFLLLLPLISNITVFLITQLYKDPFSYPDGKLFVFYTKPLYFYLKTYLPWFAIGARIVQDRQQLSFGQFAATIRKIAGISCIIALIQISVQLIFRNVALSELLGLQSRYLMQEINGPLGLRVQALFGEPKIFSAFLSLAIPLFIKDRNYKATAIMMVVGILTSSQTFWVNILGGGLLYLCLPKLMSVRWKVLSTLGMIVVLFLGVAASKEYFLKHYMANRNQPVYQMLFERSAYRYDTEIWGKNNIILGIPLQRDMELPVVDFLRDEPYLLISGYGAGNSTFIPSSYFFGQLSYQSRIEGVGGRNLNMRWFFILAEFGAVSLFFFFLILTRTGPDVPPFQRNYLAYVVVCFFFSQIDLFLIIVALLCAYNNESVNEK
ncbi:hypothetical protein SAMN05660461_5169 [Chitinophaga ginsengisegetis]|uniref:O-antigen ligase like membrane protein n=1 Tax=Chitinophaga ginsengisegetis TaxID=393003 RepID=A0A1T5P945_9BACT|nr:hypothetical protein [Chitinophaga ginsengisegetis]SKD09285.1 hypothetical protein SAMN05660461_5169 [Chitinophaga ginsengisegetis]